GAPAAHHADSAPAGGPTKASGPSTAWGPAGAANDGDPSLTTSAASAKTVPIPASGTSDAAARRAANTNTSPRENRASAPAAASTPRRSSDPRGALDASPLSRSMIRAVLGRRPGTSGSGGSTSTPGRPR